MFSFKGFFTKDKNTHLEHLEDDIINRGSNGGENAINFLNSIRDMLAGSSKAKVNMSVKWDGAPAIVCGINPENGQFFVRAWYGHEVSRSGYTGVLGSPGRYSYPTATAPAQRRDDGPRLD